MTVTAEEGFERLKRGWVVRESGDLIICLLVGWARQVVLIVQDPEKVLVLSSTSMGWLWKLTLKLTVLDPLS
jgi:hypothetical protein